MLPVATTAKTTNTTAITTAATTTTTTTTTTSSGYIVTGYRRFLPIDTCFAGGTMSRLVACPCTGAYVLTICCICGSLLPSISVSLVLAFFFIGVFDWR
jgi:hypothetical protein